MQFSGNVVVNLGGVVMFAHKNAMIFSMAKTVQKSVNATWRTQLGVMLKQENAIVIPDGRVPNAIKVG